MKAKSTSVVTPKPYFKIKFECSNRKFHEVKNELCGIADAIGVEIQDGYITEECDYEGDLERIIIYPQEKSGDLRARVLAHYGCDVNAADGLAIHLSIF